MAPETGQGLTIQQLPGLLAFLFSAFIKRCSCLGVTISPAKKGQEKAKDREYSSPSARLVSHKEIMVNYS